MISSRKVLGLRNASVDYVFLFNILHGEKPEQLLKESYRILKLGGKVGIIHWNYDANNAQRSRQWISDPDLSNAEVGLNLWGLFLSKNLTLNHITMVLF